MDVTRLQLPHGVCAELCQHKFTVRKSELEARETESDRASLVRFLSMRELSKMCPLLAKTIRHTIAEANSKWQLLLTDSKNRLCVRYEVQYSEYNSGMHYSSWHVDSDSLSCDKRKITMVIQLNSGFEGGEFQVNTGIPETLELGEGGSVIFPSETVVHRVLPCKSGCRKSLVIWAEAR